MSKFDKSQGGKPVVIICICRRLSDRTMRESIDNGARTPGAIFRNAGCAPQCGSCVPFVKAMIERAVAPGLGDAALATAE